MKTQTRPVIIPENHVVRLAMHELKAYRESPTSDNTGLIHRMKHLEKLCVISDLTEAQCQELVDEILG